MPRPGIEPGTFRSSVWRSPNWAIAALIFPSSTTRGEAIAKWCICWFRQLSNTFTIRATSQDRQLRLLREFGRVLQRCMLSYHTRHLLDHHRASFSNIAPIACIAHRSELHISIQRKTLCKTQVNKKMLSSSINFNFGRRSTKAWAMSCYHGNLIWNFLVIACTAYAYEPHLHMFPYQVYVAPMMLLPIQ